MTLRRRLTLAGAAVVALIVLVAAVVAYVAVRAELRSQVDGVLRQQASIVERSVMHHRYHEYDNHDGMTGTDSNDASVLQGRGTSLDAPSSRLAVPGRRRSQAAYVQLLDARGRPTHYAPIRLPVSSPADRGVAAGRLREVFADARLRGDHVRLITTRLPDAGAVMVGRSLSGVDDVLMRLRLVLVLLFAAGIAAAIALTRLAARSVVRPVTDLTMAAEHVEATGDLGRRVPVEGPAEVGRLAARFNAMLDRLQGSVTAQRRLIADASHELRTPVTSLRTNLEVLRDEPSLPADERRQLLDDVVHQTEELGALVNDLIDLARDGEELPAVEDVRLDHLVREAVDRAARFARDVTFDYELEPSVVEGVPDRLGRAVNNLLDNAARHSPPGGAVEVRLTGGELTVRDHGHGLEEADLPHLFDRFYRGHDARERPGSGLGLAIVRQVAEQHGGSIAAENAPGGGALFRLTLPAAPPAARS